MKRALLVLVLVAACSKPAPSAEYTAAMALYKDTLTATVDTTMMDERFIPVAAALRAVPAKNDVEKKQADALAQQIDEAQAARAALAAKGNEPVPPPPSFPSPEVRGRGPYDFEVDKARNAARRPPDIRTAPMPE